MWGLVFGSAAGAEPTTSIRRITLLRYLAVFKMCFVIAAVALPRVYSLIE
jgi:hypothetical protein